MNWILRTQNVQVHTHEERSKKMAESLREFDFKSVQNEQNKPFIVVLNQNARRSINCLLIYLSFNYDSVVVSVAF